MGYNIKGDINVLRRVYSRFLNVESLSGNTSNVLSADNNGEVISKPIDNFLSGSTIFNGKLNISDFNIYSSTTNTLIESKLDTSIFTSFTDNFYTYTSTTNNLIDSKLDTSIFANYTANTGSNMSAAFTAFTQTFYQYTADTLNLIDTKLDTIIFTSFTQSFNTYTSVTNTLINSKLNTSVFTSFTDSFYSYSSNTLNLIDTKYDKSGGNITGNVTILGNLSVNGTATTINTQNLLVYDPIIGLALSQSGSTNPTLDSGFIIERGLSGNTGLIWVEINKQYELGYTNNSYNDTNVTINQYSDLKLNGLKTNFIYDKNQLTGSTDYVMISTPSGIAWVDAANIISGSTGNIIQLGGGIGSTLRVGNNNLSLGDYSGVLSGLNNTNSGNYSTISGGKNNTNSGNNSTISGGYNNTNSGYYSFIGGKNNTNLCIYSTISGGYYNTNSGIYSFIGGGRCNTNSGIHSAIIGGFCNTNSGQYSVIGGGENNANSGYGSFIGGGNFNIFTGGTNSFIGGGIYNTASGSYSFIGGGRNNTNSGFYSSIIVGGYNNTNSGDYSFIGGGRNNTNSGNCSFIGGGYFNTNSGCLSGILGGISNLALSPSSFIIGSNLTGDTSNTTFVENFSINGLSQTRALYTTITNNLTAGLNSLYIIPTRYDATFIDYIAKCNNNFRAGQLMSTWSGNTIVYNETTTVDIGDTNPLNFSMIISGGSPVFVTSATTSGWNVKSIIRTI